MIEVILEEPITEFTTTASVDIHDGTLFLVPIPFDGERRFILGIAGRDYGAAPSETLTPTG